MKITEHQLQAAIVDALRLAGFTVRETTAFKQKGSSGVDKGIPDLLVAHHLAQFLYLGLEVKTPGKIVYSSAEQKFAHLLREYVVVQSPREALDCAICFLDSQGPKAREGACAFSRAMEKAQRIRNALPVAEKQT